jgi:Tfp pilus assembly protein PilN
MKITLNLANAPSFRDRYGLTLAVPALLIGLAVIALLGRYAGREYREYVALEKERQSLEHRRAELANRARDLQNALRQPAAQGTLRDVGFVNTLIDKKRLSLADLTLRLAALLPPEVRLSSLNLVRSGNDSDLRFQLAGKSEQALLTFIKNLQDSPDFADTSFTSEGFEQQGPSAGEITIVCQTRYIGKQEKMERKGK